MNDDESALRNLLERRAADVGVSPAIPARTRRRARRRAATALVTVALAVVALAAGGYAGVRQIVGAPVERPLRPGPSPSPIVTPSPSPALSPPVSPSPAVSAAPSPSASTPVVDIPRPCAGDDLKAVLDLQGAAGSLEGSIVFRLSWATTCSLEGYPSVAIVPAASGSPLPAQQSQTSPWWKIDGTPRPPTWPRVILTQGHTARVRVRWSTECASAGSLVWRITLPSSGSTVDAPATSGPPCNGPGQPATLEVGPFEPS